jgi:hypothetical protein
VARKVSQTPHRDMRAHTCTVIEVLDRPLLVPYLLADRQGYERCTAARTLAEFLKLNTD